MADYKSYTSQFDGAEIDDLLEKIKLSEIYTAQEKETLARLTERISELEKLIKAEANE